MATALLKSVGELGKVVKQQFRLVTGEKSVCSSLRNNCTPLLSTGL